MKLRSHLQPWQSVGAWHSCPDSSVPRAPEQLSCAAVGLRPVRELKACGICSSLDTAFPALLLPLPVPQPPWRPLGSIQGYTAEELSGARIAAHTVSISTSNLPLFVLLSGPQSQTGPTHFQSLMKIFTVIQWDKGVIYKNTTMAGANGDPFECCLQKLEYWAWKSFNFNCNKSWGVSNKPNALFPSAPSAVTETKQIKSASFGFLKPST